MKKLIDFLTDPFFCLSFGLFSSCWVVCCLSLHDSFDFKSAFFGGVFMIALDIFGYGCESIIKLFRSKKSSGQDLDD